MDKWLSVVGVSEAGLEGLGDHARGLVERAEVLVGGERHLSHLPEDPRPRITWANGLGSAIDQIADHAGKPVCVLASGDPLNFGIGTKLVSRFGIDAMEIIPGPGTFALMAARMGWSLADGTVRCISCHAFPVSVLNRHLLPGMRLLVLSRDGKTPAEITELLSGRGFGMSPITVFEHLGGPEEGRYDTVADEWEGRSVRPLNAIAIQCHPGADAQYWSETPGLPEDAFRHDGKITKRHVRAATLAQLAPLPGQLLWDVGAGSAAVAIEWLRAAEGCRAIAIEQDENRWNDITMNADTLGVPQLELIKAAAPRAFDNARKIGGGPPDAVFAGGGLSQDGLLEACLDALKPGGRLVANGVTLESQARLMAMHETAGGELAKISIARSGPVGRMTTMRPAMDVLQWSAIKR